MKGLCLWLTILSATFVSSRGHGQEFPPPLLPSAEKADASPPPLPIVDDTIETQFSPKKVEPQKKTHKVASAPPKTDQAPAKPEAIPPAVFPSIQAEDANPPAEEAPEFRKSRILPALGLSAESSSDAGEAPCTSFLLEECLEHCRRGGGFFLAGGGFYLIQPNFETNPALVFRRQEVIGGAFVTEVRQRDFRYSMDVAPLAWFGYVSGSGLGARVRYFQFSDTASEVFTADAFTDRMSTTNPLGAGIYIMFPDAGDRLATYSDLRLTVWDFEAIQLWTPGAWQVLGAAGIRYANVQQSYLASFIPAPGQALGAQDLFSNHSFNGAGPTVAFEVKRPVGEFGVALYSNMRGSILFGTGSQQALHNVFNNSGFLVSQNEVNTRQADVLPIGELELGLEVSRPLGRARIFGQVGFVGQIWWGAGNAAQTGPTFDRYGGSPENSNNFGFVGMVFRGGLNF